MNDQEISPSYDPKATDQKWLRFWEENHLFTANPNSPKPKFCIVIPPPNVTGVLHMGHALVNTLQDILIRWKRMSGYETLWVPGTDHAGIATQTVIEKHLLKTQKKRRTDFSREDFLAHVWAWKEENEKNIIHQLKKLGCSCDWSRIRFTMDEGNNRAVRSIFKKLFDQNLIYRGDYLVNWDWVTQTAISDDEVEYEERQSSLWFFKYPLKDHSRFITIATTRPETMLGDTAIAVSSSDPRYAALIGKTVILPLINREIPIIADHRVDPEFGTGAVKVTPAHDPNDYAIGMTHNLPFITIMTPNGLINENGGTFKGMTMEQARAAVVNEMQTLGLVEKIEPHTHRVGVSYRSKAVVEPYISKQWFVRMSEFAKLLESIVKEKRVQLIPKNWENVYFHWINNLRDWCISRQLWWGHRIPIWYHAEEPNRMICYDGSDIPDEVKKNPEKWTQDEDVLDTWFSSALWPFAALGWPNETEELKAFYPNSVLVTGHDILFFWVARMIFMGEYAMSQVPFPEVFLHGLIYGKSYWRNNPEGGITYLNDEEREAYELGKPIPPDVQSKWEKMSKSKGNVIDPLKMIELYGTDAMRMALTASASQNRQIDLDRRRFEEFKNFANKVWNGARFVMMNVTDLSGEELSKGLDTTLFTLEDRWILSKLNQTIRDVNHHLSSYLFDQSALRAYDFFWNDFCAYYVEIVKPILFGKTGTAAVRTNKQKILVIVLCNAIRLLHPMAPFITEGLFAELKKRLASLTNNPAQDSYTKETILALQADCCLNAPYPQVIEEKDIDASTEHAFDLISSVVYTLRNIRGEMKLTPGTSTDIYIIGKEDSNEFRTVKQNQNMISALVRTKTLTIQTNEPHLGFASTGVINNLTLMIPLPQENLLKEKERLMKEESQYRVSLGKLRTQLANSEFTSKAPPHLVKKMQEQCLQTERELSEIENKLKIL